MARVSKTVPGEHLPNQLKIKGKMFRQIGINVTRDGAEGDVQRAKAKGLDAILVKAKKASPFTGDHEFAAYAPEDQVL